MIRILLKGITAPAILASEHRNRFRRLHISLRDVGTVADRPLTSWNHTDYNSTKNATPESKASSLSEIKYFSQIQSHFRLSAVDKKMEINLSSPASYSTITRYSDHALLMRVDTSIILNHVWFNQAVVIFLYESSLHKFTISQRNKIPLDFREVGFLVAWLRRRDDSKIKNPDMLERIKISSKQRAPINYRLQRITHNNYARGNRS